MHTIKVVSLYGEVRKPTDAMMDAFDGILIVPDIDARSVMKGMDSVAVSNRQGYLRNLTQ